MLKIHLLSVVLVTGILVAVCGESHQATTVQTSDSAVKKLDSLRYERAAHTSTKLSDGRVLIAGGMRVNGEFHDTAEVFDPKTGKFEVLPSKMAKKRVSHTATLLNDGRVLIVGGWSNRSAPETSSEIFDPKTGRFSESGPMSFRRSGHTATLLKNGEVLIAGGQDGSEFTALIEVFEPSKNKFRAAGNMKLPRNSHTATLIDDRRILLTGGEVRPETVVSSAEILDPSTGKSEILESGLAFKRYKHDAVSLDDDKVLIYGGSGPGDLRGRLKAAEVFDPGTRKFSRVGDMNFERFKVGGSAVLLKDGRVLIAGGAKHAEIYDPEKGEFELVDGDLGGAFFFASATLLADGRALIVGGYRFREGASPVATNGAWVY